MYVKVHFDTLSFFLTLFHSVPTKCQGANNVSPQALHMFLTFF